MASSKHANRRKDAPLSKANNLDQNEEDEFVRCKDVVRRGLSTFIEVGQALLAIQVGHLYRMTHSTFEAFCKDEFDLKRSYAYRLIDSAKVMDELSPIGDDASLPANESQIRELVMLPNAEVRRETWKKVVQASRNTKSPITAKLVKEIAASSKRPSKKAARILSSNDSSPKVKPVDICSKLQQLLHQGDTEHALDLVAQLKRVLIQAEYPPGTER